MPPTVTPGRWSNWAGNQSADPSQVVAPSSTDELAAVIRRAAEDGRTVKAVGSGHSFTAIASAGDGVLVRPHGLTAVRELDREAGTVTVESGLPLARLNRLLAASGSGADQHGRHRGTDRRRSDQHRHPRHRPRLGLAGRAAPGRGDRAGRRQRSALLADRGARAVRRAPGWAWARSAWSAR